MKKRTKDFNYYAGKKYDGMMGRCYRPSDRSYFNYGGRGIKVCSDWIKDINNFKSWLLGQIELLGIDIEYFVQNSNKLQLDRIDSESHYTPTNCRLINPQTNMRNRRCRVLNKKVLISAEGEKINL